MSRTTRILSIASLSLIGIGAMSQNKTIAGKEKTDRGPAIQHKVMVIPFEPRLYMGEIDFAIHAETGLSAKQIKHQFRDGLNEQITKSLKANKFGVVDLMEDTIKYKKDTEGLYSYLSYEYVKIPDQNNYQPPKKEKVAKPIEKGQLNVETNTEQRFMNAKLTNPKFIPQLYGKYKTDVFVFINQLDIKSAGTNDPGQPYKLPSSLRKIVVHYTVYTKEGKEINSGVLDEEFSEELNTPKKIIDKHFSKLSQTLVLRINKALNPLTTH